MAVIQSKAFDKLYRQAVKLPPGKARDRLYVQMNRADGGGYGMVGSCFENTQLAGASLGDGIQETSDFIVGLAVSGCEQINGTGLLRK